MWEKLEKIIKLIEKTGDKCVILNDKNSPFVIMTLADYEKLNFHQREITNLTQEELLDKINREIAIWRSVNQENETKQISDLDISEKIVDNKLNFTKEEKDVNPQEQGKDNDNDQYLVESVD